MDRCRGWPLNVADILRSMADAVITTDAALKITSMNAAAEAMFGVSEAEAVGKSCRDVVQSETWPRNCPVRGVWERGECVVNFNVPLERRDGGRLRVSTSASLLKSATGDRIGVVVAIRDIGQFLWLLDELDRRDQEINRQEEQLKMLLRGRERLGNIVGKGAKMQEIFDLVQVVAKSEVTVLLQGESGTGKELIASTVHALSQRKEGPFLKVSCAALPESLLESELFGHVKGAFTGAIKDKPGRFELADRGTILLDDVSEMSPSIQVKLLRVLQDHEFERVGGTRTIKVDLRVMAASNRDLQAAVGDGRFREDLFYRLNVVPIMIPPLRERKEDVPLLVDFILGRLATKTQQRPRTVSPDAMNLLMEYDWPGNVRELENALEFALVRQVGDPLVPQSLPPWIQREERKCHGSLKEIAEEREREEIVKRVAEFRGKVSAAAKALGVGRTTLWRKMKHYQIFRG